MFLLKFLNAIPAHIIFPLGIDALEDPWKNGVISNLLSKIQFFPIDCEGYESEGFFLLFKKFLFTVYSLEDYF